MSGWIDSETYRVKTVELVARGFGALSVPYIEYGWVEDAGNRFYLRDEFTENIRIQSRNIVTEFKSWHGTKVYTVIDGKEEFKHLYEIPDDYVWHNDDAEDVTEYTVTRYDLKTRKKKVFKLVEIDPEEEDMTEWEINYIRDHNDERPEIEMTEGEE